MPRPFGRPGAENRNLCKTIRLPRERKAKPAPAPESAPEPPPDPGAIERDAALEAAGVPRCPCCGERDRCRQEKPAEWWCNRCCGWLSALSPPPGKHFPDF